MSDDTNNMNRLPEENGTDETPALPEPGAAELALASSLRELVPAHPAINRDRLMFAAGASSRLNSTRLWQFAAGILAAVGFAAGMYFKPPVIIIREVSVSPAPPLEASPPPPNAALPPAPVIPAVSEPDTTPEVPSFVHTRTVGDPYLWLQIRDDVLSSGLGALPDVGRQPSPARNVSLNQPGTLPRGSFGEK